MCLSVSLWMGRCYRRTLQLLVDYCCVYCCRWHVSAILVILLDICSRGSPFRGLCVTTGCSLSLSLPPPSLTLSLSLSLKEYNSRPFFVICAAGSADATYCNRTKIPLKSYFIRLVQRLHESEPTDWTDASKSEVFFQWSRDRVLRIIINNNSSGLIRR